MPNNEYNKETKKMCQTLNNFFVIDSVPNENAALKSEPLLSQTDRRTGLNCF